MQAWNATAEFVHKQGTAGHSRCVPGLSVFLAVHSPIVAPHLQIGVGILNDHQPDPRPEEEASPKNRRIPAHNKCCSGFLLQGSPKLILVATQIVKQQLL